MNNNLGIMGKNKNINIYYNSMSNFTPPEKLIKFKSDGISLSKRNEKLLRDTYGISLRGKRKNQQKQIIKQAAKELRGGTTNFRNVRYAYRFLARLYNQAAEQVNEDAFQEFQQTQQQQEETALRNAITEFRVNNLNEVQYVVSQENLETMGIEGFVRAIQEGMGTERIVIRIVYLNGEVKNITWRPDFVEQLIDYLNEEEEIEGLANFSDTIFLTQIKQINYIEFYRVNQAAGNQAAQPAFFKWLNKTPFDLSKFGIYKSVKPENYTDNCLIKALKAANIEQKKLDACKGLIFNRGVAICKLNMIADIIGKNIRLRRNDNRKHSNIYGTQQYNEEISIGVIDDHYFYVCDVDFTSYAMRNYMELMNKYETYDEWRTIYKVKNKRGKLYDERDEKRCISSFQAIKYLYDNRNEMLDPIGYDDNIFGTIFWDKGMDFVDEDAMGLDYDEDSCLKLNIWDEDKEQKKKEKADKLINCYFDFETSKTKIKDFFAHEEINKLKKEFHKKKKTKYYITKLQCLKKRLWRTIHRPYMCCAVIKVNGKGYKLYAIGDDCGKEILIGACEILRRNDADKKIRMIAHNCGFDYRFMMKYMFADDQKTKGNGLMNAKGKFYHKKEIYDFEFKDSCKLITMPLKKFGKCFNLKQEKEVFPYTLYNNYKNLIAKFVPIEYAKPEWKNDMESYNTFVENVRRLGFSHMKEDIEHFDVLGYAKYYCMRDCEVLRDGYETFRKWCLEDEVIQIDVNSVWTIASLANKVLMKHDCFEGVYQVGGRVRYFLQKCVIGGRCCTRDNKKWKVKEKIADLDAVSLYPSAFYRMEGFLKGKPKVIKEKDLNMDYLNNTDGYFVKIRITKVGKKYHIPCMSYVDKKSGLRNWTNNMVGKIAYVDKTTLQDWINFQQIEFDLLAGYYYNNGRNPKIREVIKRIFDLRLQKKKEKNPIQVVYKLIMNSAYGKTILKPITTEEKVIKGETEKNKFLDRNYARIIEFHKVYDNRADPHSFSRKPKYIFKLQKDIIEHFNNAPVGIECLSMSKRIMFEPMCLAEDLDINIYITDTDSMHIEYDKVKTLVDKFQEKYGRNLEGKQLGQLHIDFDLDGAVGEIYSTQSIYLGKKCYIDIIEGKNEKDETIVGHHIRMKGIPETTLYYTANKLTNKQDVNDRLWEMYDYLYEGVSLDFDLLEGGTRPNFKFNGDMTIGYMKEFVRKLSFGSEKGSIHKVLA